MRTLRAMGEVILVHAPKGRRAREVNVPADAPQLKEAIRHAIGKGWAMVLHYEFRWLAGAHGSGARAERMAELAALVAKHPQHPWTDMFAGEELASEWRALILRYPDRFVLALDNVWPEHWSERYVRQIDLWRTALGKLPAEVAHAVAHGNAEGLWKLAPATAGRGCAALNPRFRQ